VVVQFLNLRRLDVRNSPPTVCSLLYFLFLVVAGLCGIRIAKGGAALRRCMDPVDKAPSFKTYQSASEGVSAAAGSSAKDVEARGHHSVLAVPADRLPDEQKE
jgi:hypothetical protein